jgi:hypothetical protein
MTLAEFIAQIPNFGGHTHTEKIKLLGWYMHTQEQRERFNQAEIRRCYDVLHLSPPELSTYFRRMVGRKPPELLKDTRGYRLEGNTRRKLDARFGVNSTTYAISKLLNDLPTQIPTLEERVFLSEALACYKVGAFRAAIVMTWNLAFDHLTSWILADPVRLAAYNTHIGVRYPKRKGFSVTRLEDFEEFKESEVIEICNTASLFSRNIVKILQEKLVRRNIAAHPSRVSVTQHQADDAITDLVTNVVLKLVP